MRGVRVEWGWDGVRVSQIGVEHYTHVNLWKYCRSRRPTLQDTCNSIQRLVCCICVYMCVPGVTHMVSLHLLTGFMAFWSSGALLTTRLVGRDGPLHWGLPPPTTSTCW